MERMFSLDYMHRRPGRRLGNKDGFAAILDLPEVPLNLAAKQYPDLEGKHTLDYLEKTGLTQEDLAQVGLAPMKPAGKIFPGLRVQMAGQKKTEPLSVACERAAEAANNLLRKKGYIV